MTTLELSKALEYHKLLLGSDPSAKQVNVYLQMARGEKTLEAPTDEEFTAIFLFAFMHTFITEDREEPTEVILLGRGSKKPYEAWAAKTIRQMLSYCRILKSIERAKHIGMLLDSMFVVPDDGSTPNKMFWRVTTIE